MNCGYKWKKIDGGKREKNARLFYLPKFRIMSCYSVNHGGNQCSLLFEVLNFLYMFVFQSVTVIILFEAKLS